MLQPVALPVVVLGFVYEGADVPLCSIDGSHHVELVQLLRDGGQWPGWYPTGFHSVAATFLSLMPWVDSAQGTIIVAVGLTIIGQMSVFGLELVLLRSPLAAAVGALVTAQTYWYPYLMHLVSVFAMSTATVLALALWTIAGHYLERRGDLRLASLFALLVAAVGLSHATELYTVTVGLVVLLAASLRRVNTPRLVLDLAFAAAMAALLMAPYVSILLAWAKEGGATEVGAAFFDGVRMASFDPASELVNIWARQLSTGWLLDLPARVVLLVVGVWWALKHRGGRTLLALCLTFIALLAVFRYVQLPLVRHVYAVTLPWAVDYRLATVPAILLSLVTAAGVVRFVSITKRVRAGASGSWRTSTSRFATKAIVLAVFLSIMFSLPLLVGGLRSSARTWLTYTAEDAAAMHWLRENVTSGEVVANDGQADAGIWAPYKSQAEILLPNVLPVERREEKVRALGLVAQPGRADQLEEEACALGIRYLFRGAAANGDAQRQLRPLGVLRTAPALQEVFTSGQAAVFRLRCQN